MNDFKLKLVITILSGIVFSFIFIILAFVLPEQKEQVEASPSKFFKEVAKAVKE